MNPPTTQPSTGQTSGGEQRRTSNKDAYIEEPLSNIRDEDLPADVKEFHDACLPKVDYNRLLRAAKVAKAPKTYCNGSGPLGWRLCRQARILLHSAIELILESSILKKI
ncbi:hypothetical protein EDB80DRAFT_886748 [Ilyonectria destructans]|nr:hypothetical protein EDB80DRAFT_886748 [Ilyonectria destructans]